MFKSCLFCYFRASRWVFCRSRPLMTFFQAPIVPEFFHSLRPSTALFLGGARRWLFSQVAPAADFYPRSRPSLTSFPGFAHRWLFSQVTTVADFFSRSSSSPTTFQGFAHCRIFSEVAPVADFYSRPLKSLTSFSGCTHRCFFSRLRKSLTLFSVAWVRRWLLFQVAPVPFFSQVAPVAVYFSRPRLSLTSIQYAHIAEFFPGRAHRWFLPQVAHVTDFFPVLTNLSMTSFSGCASRWFFS